MKTRMWTKEALRRALLLYAVSSRASLRTGETLYGAVKELLDGGITMLQWREKGRGRSARGRAGARAGALPRGGPSLYHE